MLRHRILGFREESELPNEMISKCPTLTETSVGEATTQSSFCKVYGGWDESTTPETQLVQQQTRAERCKLAKSFVGGV